jgi:hypothetical protein
MVDDNETDWFTYYQDQFDGKEGNVVAPSSLQYPLSAVRAYQHAKVNWDEKKREAKNKSYTAGFFLVVINGILVYVVLSAIASIHGPVVYH